MRGIRPEAWAGLFLDTGMVAFMFIGVTYGDFSAQPQALQQLMQELTQSPSFYILYISFLVLQVLALWCISLRFKAGLFLAAFSSFFLMPFSVIFVMGCFASHYTNKYDALAPAPPPGTGRSFQAASNNFFWLLSGACGAMTLFFASAEGISPSFVLLLSFTVGSVYRLRRAKSVPPLTLHPTSFVIRPHILAQAVSIPYADVRTATLLADDSLRLDLRTNQGALTMHWRLNDVAPNERREALEDFGKQLQAHGVQLY